MAHGEHFRKNCVGRNRGVGLWRLNQRVIFGIATVGGIRDRRMAEDDEEARQMLWVSTNLGRSRDKLAAEHTEFRVAQVSDK